MSCLSSITSPDDIVVDCDVEQSAWRGYNLRQQLNYALKFVNFATDIDLSLPNFDVDALLSKARFVTLLVCLVSCCV